MVNPAELLKSACKREMAFVSILYDWTQKLIVLILINL